MVPGPIPAAERRQLAAPPDDEAAGVFLVPELAPGRRADVVEDAAAQGDGVHQARLPRPQAEVDVLASVDIRPVKAAEAKPGLAVDQHAGSGHRGHPADRPEDQGAEAGCPAVMLRLSLEVDEYPGVVDPERNRVKLDVADQSGPRSKALQGSQHRPDPTWAEDKVVVEEGQDVSPGLRRAAVGRRPEPQVAVVQHDTRLTADNALAIIGAYDIVADGSDNFATRFLINDACFFAKKILVSAAVTEFDGQLATFKAHDGAHPCYRCIFPEPPPPGTAPSCSETGVLGAAAGVMGTLQALEVLKEITGAGESLAGYLLIYDALATNFRKVRVKRDPECALCGGNAIIHDLSIHEKLSPSP